MRRVRFDADAVENENVEILQAVDRFVGDEIQIGRVGKIVKAVSDHRKFAVDDFERRDLDLFADAERRIVDDRVRNQLRQAAAEMRRLKMY